MSSTTSFVRPIRALCTIAVALVTGSSAASADNRCQPTWVPTFGEKPGVNSAVSTFKVFDDGRGEGPALYVGGYFDGAGAIVANGIARWDGSSWSPLGDGFAGGPSVTRVADIEVFDDGSGGGPALYACGAFTTASGVVVNHIAKWDGTTWSALGDGPSPGFGGPFNPIVPASSMAVFDDGLGAGPALYVGGSFTTAGGVTVNGIARWDGESWSALADGVEIVVSAVSALMVFDDGSGPALYVGSTVDLGNDDVAQFIARWDGVAWSSVGGGMNDLVAELTVFDDGSGAGPALYAGGWFTLAGGAAASRVAKWNGTAWSAVGAGIGGPVTEFASFDAGDGAGPSLYAGGSFQNAGGHPALYIARWDGETWLDVAGGADRWVHAMTVFDDGAGRGPVLYVGGEFQQVAELSVDFIATTDGESWSSIGPGVDDVIHALAIVDDGEGAGPSLYAGGWFKSAGSVPAIGVAKWTASACIEGDDDGGTWSALGEGLSYGEYPGFIHALTSFDDGSGPALHAGGTFTHSGDTFVSGAARWSAARGEWMPLGSGLGGPEPMVHAMVVHDDGSGDGPALYAAGYFSSAGGVPASNIARWDGTTWSALGSGTNGAIVALTVFDDGSGAGPALYAGGSFTSAGGVSVQRIARWYGPGDGRGWAALGSVEGIGINGSVSALTVFEDGSSAGPALLVGGGFLTAGGTTVNHIAAWRASPEGGVWSPLGTGMDWFVSALTVFDDGTGSGPALVAAGGFTTAGGVSASSIAQWTGPLDGGGWSALGDGLSGGESWNAPVLASCPSFACGPALFVGGGFLNSPGGDSYLALWRGCPESPECAAADVNCDGSVDGADLGVLLGAWGDCDERRECPADLNGDGAVDGADLGVLLGAWG